MPSKELQKFTSKPVRHSLWRTWQISQAVRPIMRLADPTLHRGKVAEAIDIARILYGARAVAKTAEIVDGKKILAGARNVLTEEVQIGPVKLPAGVFAGAAAAGAVAVVESLVHLEKNREQTALQQVPVEAQKVRDAYDRNEQKQRSVVVHGVKMDLNNVQIMAHNYAVKTLDEMEKSHKTRSFKQARKAIENLLQQAYGSTPNPELQSAIEAVAADAFEAVLLEKEIPETAAAITKRPQDVLVNDARELARKGARGIERLERFPVLGSIVQVATPKFVDRAITALAGDKPVAAGNLTLDPRAFINAGSEKTQKQVRDELERDFANLIETETKTNATGAQVRVLNDALPIGVKISETAKDNEVNMMLGALFVKYHPERSPKVAEVTGVLDVYQNNPADLGPEFAPTEKNKTRRK